MRTLEFDDPERLGRVELMRAKGTGLPPEWDERFPTLPAQRERRLRMSASSTYLIGAEGSELVKIGHARNPQRRLAGLQTGQPAQLTLLWSQVGDYERALHRKFAAYRVRGEWFDLTPLGSPVEIVRAAVAAMSATPGVTDSAT
ncbi:GIY-YIG nuclease family protein [[Kitasatospora] papulosa]|uniref:GIY-YIG nuclease family protein n=1 Tax=[Kitasatospora] papulosa TaxID=1464011 RepID=UPI0036859A5C